MKPILAALIVAALLDSAHGVTHASAEVVEPTRSLPSATKIRISATDDREIYSRPLFCVYHERRSAAVHLFRCRGSKRCILPAAQPLPKLLGRFKSARIVKFGPLSDGCTRLTLIGKLKLTDAPPWAGTTYSGWRPFTGTP